MQLHNKIRSLLFPLVVGFSPALTANNVPSQKPLNNDFPTQARVEYVLGCMNSRGGQNYTLLYGCVCAVDKIASQLSYQEYEEATVFNNLWSTAGERGGVFRDPPKAKASVTKLKAVLATADRSCFVRGASVSKSE